MTLRPATPAEITLFQTASHSTWGSHLSLAEYISRDWKNYATPYMNLLVPPPAIAHSHYHIFAHENAPHIPLAACETLTRRCWISSATGEIAVIPCKTIASVFTLPEHRRQGVAHQMISQLAHQFDIDHCDISLLYSEVGEYYSQFGFTSHNVPVHRINYAYKPDQQPFHKLISSDDFSSIISHYAKYLLSTLPPSAVCLEPTVDILNWFNNRSPVIGVSIDSTNYALATDSTLLLMHADSVDLQKALLTALCSHIKADKLTIWKTDLSFPIEEPLFENSSLSALRINPASKIDPNLTWYKNGKLFWF